MAKSHLSSDAWHVLQHCSDLLLPVTTLPLELAEEIRPYVDIVDAGDDLCVSTTSSGRSLLYAAQHEPVACIGCGMDVRPRMRLYWPWCMCLDCYQHMHPARNEFTAWVRDLQIAMRVQTGQTLVDDDFACVVHRRSFHHRFQPNDGATASAWQEFKKYLLATKPWKTNNIPTTELVIVCIPDAETRERVAWDAMLTQNLQVEELHGHLLLHRRSVVAIAGPEVLGGTAAWLAEFNAYRKKDGYTGEPITLRPHDFHAALELRRRK